MVVKEKIEGKLESSKIFILVLVSVIISVMLYSIGSIYFLGSKEIKSSNINDINYIQSSAPTMLSFCGEDTAVIKYFSANTKLFFDSLDKNKIKGFRIIIRKDNSRKNPLPKIHIKCERNQDFNINEINYIIAYGSNSAYSRTEELLPSGQCFLISDMSIEAINIETIQLTSSCEENQTINNECKRFKHKSIRICIGN